MMPSTEVRFQYTSVFLRSAWRSNPSFSMKCHPWLYYVILFHVGAHNGGLLSEVPSIANIKLDKLPKYYEAVLCVQYRDITVPLVLLMHAIAVLRMHAIAVSTVQCSRQRIERLRGVNGTEMSFQIH